jgi:hypothetical protein
MAGVTTTPDPLTDEECRHCKLVQASVSIWLRAEAGEEVNLPDVADRIVEALADFILNVMPFEERAKMIGYALEHWRHTLQADNEGETRR